MKANTALLAKGGMSSNSSGVPIEGRGVGLTSTRNRIHYMKWLYENDPEEYERQRLVREAEERPREYAQWDKMGDGGYRRHRFSALAEEYAR